MVISRGAESWGWCECKGCWVDLVRSSVALRDLPLWRCRRLVLGLLDEVIGAGVNRIVETKEWAVTVNLSSVKVKNINTEPRFETS
jgi:hypothetical protein